MTSNRRTECVSQPGMVRCALGGEDCWAGIDGGLVWQGLGGDVRTSQVEAAKPHYASDDSRDGRGLRRVGSPWCVPRCEQLLAQEGAEDKASGDGKGRGQELSARGNYSKSQGTKFHQGLLRASRAHRGIWLTGMLGAGGKHCTKSSGGPRTGAVQHAQEKALG